MSNNRHIWLGWSEWLHRWGLHEWVAVLLESLGPLTILGAQAIYLCQPVLGQSNGSNHLNALAYLLEDSSEAKAFAAFLREDSPLWN